MNIVILASGEERIVHAQNKVIFKKENIPVLMTGAAQDITARKQAEKEQEAAAKRYSAGERPIGCTDHS